MNGWGNCHLCDSPALYETYSGRRLLCSQHGASWTAYLLAQAFRADEEGLNETEHDIFARWWKQQREPGQEG